jgi:poly(A) polymerase
VSAAEPPRIDPPWLAKPGPQAICAALTGAGHAALYVGGCVRDALLGRTAADIDVATDARPETVMALAAAAGLRAAPTGIEHGTVTVIHDGAPVEVTTFRRDVETDGRRAVVAFSTDIAEDAARRDLTMNALYARPDGTVVDPLGGLPDLRAGRIRFVGDPEARIAEDYLRILRFFRFHAWYGHPEDGLDPAGLAACAAGRAGIARLSRERVGAEIARLLEAPDPGPSVAAMAAAGVLEAALPEARPELLPALVRAERAAGAAPDWRRRLAALGPLDGRAEALRLSRADAAALKAIEAARAADAPPAAAAYRFGPEAARAAALLRAAAAGTPPPSGLEAEIGRGAAAAFPLRAADLARSGPDLGRALRRLEEAWIASDFALGRDALIAQDMRQDS